MKKNLFLIVISSFMILFSVYRIWLLYTPRVGPIGNGRYHISVYFSVYCGLLAGVSFLLLGIVNLIKIKRQGTK